MKQVKIMLLFVASAICFFSCKKEITNDNITEKNYDTASGKKNDARFAKNDMVIFWHEKAIDMVADFNPPPASARLFAMVQIAVHDALNSIKPKYKRYVLLNERSKDANPDAAVASAAYWTLRALTYPTEAPLYRWYAESLATIPDGESKESGITLGKHAADAILANRANDGLLQALADVAIPDGTAPGAYRSTLPFSDPVLGLPKVKAIPNWGTALKSFVVASNDQFRPAGPYSVGSALYAQDFNEVKSKGARVNATRSDEETEIGRFWLGAPARAWNLFARNAVADKKMDAWRTARLFALMNVAMIDAITGCFEAKYHFFYWRPETAIRLADDGNPNTTGNANWLPMGLEASLGPDATMNMYTPPMPDYPSGHASFGGAASEILKLCFGTDNTSVDLTSGSSGVTRHYSLFSRAARENSLSRMYVGYHFRKACLDGEEQGRQIATYVFNHSFEESGE